MLKLFKIPGFSGFLFKVSGFSRFKKNLNVKIFQGFKVSGNPNDILKMFFYRVVQAQKQSIDFKS